MVKKKVIVLGGGIVGLSTAYYLIQEGHEVTIIDKGRLDSGASHVNAGYLTPSHIVPMAAPGMISKGMKWMFNAKSPFYIKPRFLTKKTLLLPIPQRAIVPFKSL